MVSFTDCHVSQICRPEDNENLQNSVYNGMNRVHALKFTATGGPDGILQNLGVVAGRRHDRIGLRNSRINTKRTPRITEEFLLCNKELLMWIKDLSTCLMCALLFMESMFWCGRWLKTLK